MVRVWTQDSVVGPITVVAGEHGVREIAFADTEDVDIAGRNGDRDEEVATAIDRWLSGEVHSLDFEIDMSGIDGFRRRVLDTLVQHVGWGETVTYGELAELAGSPGAARAVGSAMANNPILFAVPCHRVLAAGGRIGGYGGTVMPNSDPLSIKRTLLAHEGVTVKG